MSELKLKVVQKNWETPDTCTIYFENVAGSTVFYKPGQFLTFLLNLKGNEVRRSYSLCTVPVKDKHPAVAVKRVANGLGSNYLIDHLKIGDVLESMHPTGIFVPELSLSNKKEYFLIAAGSGISPLFSILQTILLKEPKSIINLIFSNRNEASIIFKTKLDDLELDYQDRLKVVHILTKPTVNWQGFRGRINEQLLKDLISELNQFPKTDALFFLCGPTDFMATAERTIKELGFKTSAIKKEEFSTTNLMKDAKNEIGEEKQVKILYQNQEHEFLLAAGKSILEGAQENGIRLPYSCTNGFCTACIGTCIEGEVDISRSDVLSENEKKQGLILTCIGRPISSKVVVKID